MHKLLLMSDSRLKFEIVKKKSRQEADKNFVS